MGPVIKTEVVLFSVKISLYWFLAQQNWMYISSLNRELSTITWRFKKQGWNLNAESSDHHAARQSLLRHIEAGLAK